MADRPTTIAVAAYATELDAEHDFAAVRAVKSTGQLDHLAIAVVAKDADGKLHVNRHNSTAKHLAWGGGILGAVTTVVFAPLGVVFLAPLMAHTAVLAGAGGLAGHFWHNIPKADIDQLGETLADGEFGLVIVAVNPQATDVAALLGRAETVVVVNDVEDAGGALEAAFESAGV